MTEIWKDIEGYEGSYQVSNLGRVRTLDRIVTDKLGRARTFKGCVKRFYKKPNGYYSVNLSKDGEDESRYVHRLVAETFIPNPYNLPQVNHKDEDKTNNRAENLEWCTSIYNVTYNNVAYRKAEPLRKKVRQSLPDGTWIATYASAMEAARQTGLAQSHISDVCRGEKEFAYGYRWEYED